MVISYSTEPDYEKMQDIIEAQGRQDITQKKARFEHNLLAPKSAYIHAIDNLKTSTIASLAGAPIDKYAGIDLHKKVGDKGDVIFTIYANFNSSFGFTLTLLTIMKSILKKILNRLSIIITLSDYFK